MIEHLCMSVTYFSSVTSNNIFFNNQVISSGKPRDVTMYLLIQRNFSVGHWHPQVIWTEDCSHDFKHEFYSINLKSRLFLSFYRMDEEKGPKGTQKSKKLHLFLTAQLYIGSTINQLKCSFFPRQFDISVATPSKNAYVKKIFLHLIATRTSFRP